MQVNSLLRFSAVCPFLGHSTTSSLRTMASNNANNVSQLTASALKCPMMGPKLAAISHARTYASVAGSKEVEAIHKVSLFSLDAKAGAAKLTLFIAKGYPFRPTWNTFGQMPSC